MFFATGFVIKDGVLRIHGTDGADKVTVSKPSQDQVKVKNVLPGVTKVFDATGIEQLEVLVFAGNDKVVINHDLPAFVDGGAGKDKLIGGFGPDILLGAGGKDVLKGRRGRDVLIGGLAKDTIKGGSGQDILIGGTTSHDENAEALYAILAEWNSDRGYQTRVENIRGTGSGPDFDARLNFSFFLQAGNTVFDDLASDKLAGGRTDWSSTEESSGLADFLTIRSDEIQACGVAASIFAAPVPRSDRATAVSWWAKVAGGLPGGWSSDRSLDPPRSLPIDRCLTPFLLVVVAFFGRPRFKIHGKKTE